MATIDTAFDRLMLALRAAKHDVAAALSIYERDKDHDHGRGPIPAGAPCPGGDCNVRRARELLAVLHDVPGKV
jgi:hypothetical protein